MAFTTTATARSVPVLCLLVLVCSIAQASSSGGNDDKAPSSLNSFTCNQVRELFEGGIGYPTALHSRPEHESESSMCRRGGAGGGGVGSSSSSPAVQEYTCCSLDTEATFADAAEKRLKGSVRHRNNALKKRLSNVVTSYQERLRQLTDEAENRTAAFLSHLHRIPWGEHRPVVANLYRGLRSLAVLPGGPVGSSSSEKEPVVEIGVGGDLDDVVQDFFVNLFPSVFSYVLSQGSASSGKDPHHNAPHDGRQQQQQLPHRSPVSPEYHACLKRYADQIQPFGNQPDRLLRHLRRSLTHARAFQLALRTLGDALSTTAQATSLQDGSCRRALVRLQVCPDCRGVRVRTPGMKPCRGLCLNTMRGCLAKMFEISSAWDDLIIAFENLQVGMLGQHDLQRLLIYLDMNVTDAIMTAMTDTNRIYDEVQVKCQDVPLTASPPPQSNTTTTTPSAADAAGASGAAASSNNSDVDGGEAAMAIALRNTQVLRDFRQEMRALVKTLEDSKGSFNRLPDSLCEEEDLYDQDMLSDVCWNGTGLGRYMEEVPEANFLSQVMRNKEVKVNLTDVDPSFRFLQVKESLTHMRRGLSGLLNADIMQGDSPRRRQLPAYSSQDWDGSGGGSRMGHTDVIVDDEDLVAYGSGSGSGSGDGGGEDGDKGDGGTYRPQEPSVTKKPSRPPASSGSAPALSAALLAVGLCLHSLLHTLH